MSTTPNDPAQNLASLLKGGESNSGNSTAPDAAAGDSAATPPLDPMQVFTEFTQQIAQMQQHFFDQFTGFWAAASGESHRADIGDEGW